jgi:hypothetical protein
MIRWYPGEQGTVAAAVAVAAAAVVVVVLRRLDIAGNDCRSDTRRRRVAGRGGIAIHGLGVGAVNAEIRMYWSEQEPMGVTSRCVSFESGSGVEDGARRGWRRALELTVRGGDARWMRPGGAARGPSRVPVHT